METKNTTFFLLPDPVLCALTLLNEKGYEAYVVGGAVRDLLRGVIPHDYDITTNALPEEMKSVFRDFRTVETGIAHGTLTVLIDEAPIEITTYRIDGAYTDSRHPDSVTFTRSQKEDAARRDFTVNAMAYHPKTGVWDYFGGLKDIEDKLLRTVGDSRLRFDEDALRILRALRFSAVLGYTIDTDTATAVHEKKESLHEIAAERIREEFVKLLCSDHASDVLREYADVIAVFIPEMSALRGFLQHNPHHDYDVWEHTLRALSAAPKDLCVRLAVLFHDFGKPACFFRDALGTGHFYGHAEKSALITDQILRRLRFDNATREYTVSLVRAHDTVPLPKTRQFRRIRSRHGEKFLFDWLSLIRADRTGQKETLSEEADAILKQAEAAATALVKTEERLSLATLQIKGDDLIALGYRGRAIGDALQFALEGVISEKVTNEKEALKVFIKEKEVKAPIECERKFLIAYPNTALLLSEGAEASEITQTYLVTEDNATARVRRRIYSDKTVYTYTEKRRLTAVSATEEEREIPLREYNALLTTKDLSKHPIEKTRYTLPYRGHLLEVDVYPFWEKQAVLEIELKSEDEAYEIPAYIHILREVTEDARYKNARLAKEIPSED